MHDLVQQHPQIRLPSGAYVSPRKTHLCHVLAVPGFCAINSKGTRLFDRTGGKGLQIQHSCIHQPMPDLVTVGAF